ncbi:LysR substrate-binding domain-containing protein [Stappia sp.]|uniref:LysR substrate-binding domain-containing protein n=1 Tax=Stappia sp. TaxID=1870903 RepID=UPI003A9960DF
MAESNQFPCLEKIGFLLPRTTGLPPLNGLRAFDVAGRHLNFAAAAAELGVTQGAIAQQVRGLEAHLGLRLFERGPRGVSFTAIGRAYHEQVGRAFALLLEATARVKPEPSRVTISVTPTFAAKWLIPNLPHLAQAHPDIDLRVLATESLLSFHADGIDLAIRQARAPFGANIDARLLFAQEIIAVAAPALVGRDDLPLTSDRLALLPLLQDTHNLWPVFWRAVLDADFPRTGRRTSLSQTSLSIDAALAGQGVALASRFLVEGDLAAGRLVRVLEGSLRGDRDFHLLAVRARQRRPAVTAVMDWLLTTSAAGDQAGGACEDQMLEG